MPTEPTEYSAHAVHYPTLFVNQLKNDPTAGKKIFHEYCAACHAQQPEIDIHAPRFGDHATWSAFKALGSEKLFQWTTQGHGAMPARGGCFECSDEQLKAAIRYLISGTK
ncbi:MAG: hypothetical protein A3F41_01385 [Coxiella sp. RIFCSPHIGHO2_12_FULL_44_14]|nr:MAG: hypothetical protein A3F41_01385 [Coxiella sp. RIFCSPHIGHO2_12_FULL_44_14]